MSLRSTDKMAASSENAATAPEESQMVKDICFKYIPIGGAASTLIFSTNIMNPNLFKSYFAPNEAVLANCLWFNAHLGTGLYLFSRKHLRSAPVQSRVLYSVYGSVIFNFGAVLFWATSKAILPKCSTLRCLAGIGSGIVLLAVGKKYLNYVDDQLAISHTASEE